jgi:outer membrane receptor for Fe3+-dicitrate
VVYDYPNEVSSVVHSTSWFINDKVTMTRRLTVNAGVRFDRYSSWLPEQGNPGTGPFSIQNVFPERHDFPVYNSWLPRFSFVYDIAGNGKLVVKASYGRYVGNGSTIGSGPTASQVNPNEVTARTYTNWDGSIPYTPRSTDLSSVSGGSGTRRLDPNLKAPFMEELTGGIEVGLNRDYLIRFNTVRKVDRNKSKTLDLAQPFSAYTDVRYGVDPGRDNITGTADDGTMQVWSVPRSYPTFGQVNQLITNTDDGEAVDLYTAFETSFSKQYSKGWSLLVGYTADFAKRRNVTPQNPNDALYNWQLPVWSNTLKVNGQHNLPWGLMYATTYQIQSGEWYGRIAQLRNALNALVNVQVENQVGRYDWVKLWDNRISKTFKLNDRQSIEAMFNIYNTLNSSAVLTQVNTNGPDYLKPLVGASSSGSSAGVESAILSPRIFSLGARWRF